MKNQSQIVQLREREREITFFPQGAATAPQQPVLLQQEEPLADRLLRLARPGLVRFAFIFGWLAAGIIFVKIGNFLIKVGGLK